jgi:hypothetical protein
VRIVQAGDSKADFAESELRSLDQNFARQAMNRDCFVQAKRRCEFLSPLLQCASQPASIMQRQYWNADSSGHLGAVLVE